MDVSICIHMLTHILSGKCSAGSKHYKKVERAVHKECFEGKCLPNRQTLVAVGVEGHCHK